MNKTIKKTAGSFLSLFGSKKENFVAVLMYHGVADNGWKFSVSPQAFRNQIEDLRNRGLRFLSVDGFKEFLAGNVSGKFALITFDDGYSDFLNGALPVLRQYNIPAAMFVHTDRLNQELGNDFPLMDWDNIKKISTENITIGNHSHSHPNLRTLDSEKLKQEFEQSEKIFEEKLGMVPKILAYPGGKFNQTVIDEAKSRNYSLAFTVNGGLVRPGDDPMTLKRVGFTKDTDISEFRFLTSLAGDRYEALRHKLKK